MEHMTKPSDVIRRAAKAAQEEFGGGVRALENRLGLKPWSLRGILDSQKPQSPSVDRAVDICSALGLELYIGPPRTRRSQTKPLSVGDPASGEVAGRVRDRELAEALAAIVEHWEALESDYARRDWLARLWATSPALGARRSALRRVVAWLGWRVIEGGAGERAE